MPTLPSKCGAHVGAEIKKYQEKRGDNESYEVPAERECRAHAEAAQQMWSQAWGTDNGSSEVSAERGRRAHADAAMWCPAWGTKNEK